MFVVDRLGRVMECRPLPPFMAYGALLLYLLHPWMMTLLIVTFRGTPLEDTGSVWILCVVISGLLGLALHCPCRAWRLRGTASSAHSPPKAYGRSSDSSSESEDSHGSAEPLYLGFADEEQRLQVALTLKVLRARIP
eukprot:g11421.t1